MNTKTNARKIAILAVMAGLSVAFVFIIHFPLFPAAPFLEYDPADIPILIATFAYGPLAGLFVTIIASVIQGVTVSAQSGLYGIIMHIISTSAFLLTAGFIYRFKHTRAGAAIGLLCGVLVSAAVMAVANWYITPVYLSTVIGVPAEVARDDIVRGLLLTTIIPFNLIKAGINGFIAFLLYERISALITGSWKLEIKDIDQDIQSER